MPVKGYDSVNLPSGLYRKVKELIEARADLLPEYNRVCGGSSEKKS
jgi:hypothetical protein